LRVETVDDAVLATFVRLGFKLIPKIDNINEPHVILSFKDATLLPSESAAIMADIKIVEDLIVGRNALNPIACPAVLLFLKIIKVFAWSWCNNHQQAVEEALLIVDSNFLDVKFIKHCSDVYLILLLSMFLNDSGYSNRSDEVYKLFQSLCELTSQTDLLERFPQPSSLSSSPEELTLFAFDSPPDYQDFSQNPLEPLLIELDI